MAPSRPRSMAPTAARSVVGTSWIASSGRPAARRPAVRQAWMAAELRCVSEPPRRMTALPAFRQSPPASAVTLGRLSKMTPTTPSGVRTRWILQAVRALPFGDHGADRVGERGDLLQRLRDAGDAGAVERAAIDHRGARSGRTHRAHVFRVGREDLRPLSGAALSRPRGAPCSWLRSRPLRAGMQRRARGGRCRASGSRPSAPSPSENSLRLAFMRPSAPCRPGGSSRSGP